MQTLTMMVQVIAMKPAMALIPITQIQMVTAPQTEKMISHWTQTRIPIQTAME